MRLIPRRTLSKRPRWKLLATVAAFTLVFPDALFDLPEVKKPYDMSSGAQAHGFNANRVRIAYVPASGKYRVTIEYTHIEVGEYREAFAEFETKEAAIAAYQQLAQGADFFLGEVQKSIHFHTPPQKNSPF